MLTESNLIAYVSAFGSPLVALVAGGFAAYFSYRSWRTAKNKLRLDLFDKRYNLYVQIQGFLQKVYSDKWEAETDNIKFLNMVAEAKWIFDDKVFDYLVKDLHSKLSEYSRVGADMADSVERGPEWQSSAQVRRKVRTDLVNQESVLIEKMTPFLRLED